MKGSKKIIAFLLAFLMMIVTPINPMAATSPKETSIKETKITIKDYVYTGKAATGKLNITVKDGSKTLVRGTDYVVSGDSDKKVGSHKVTITGTGKYEGQVKVGYKIVPDFSISRETFRSVTLDDKSQTFEIEVKGVKASQVKYKSYNKKVDIDEKTGKVTLKKGIDEGEYKIRVEYNGYTKFLYFTVKDPEISVSKKTFMSTDLAKKAQKLQIDVKYVKLSKVSFRSYDNKVVVDKDGDVRLKKGLEAGRYKIRVDADGYVKNVYITVKDPEISISKKSFMSTTLMKGAQKVKISVTGVKASDVTYKSYNNQVVVNKKNGEVTLKKGLKAGEYRIRVNADGFVKNLYITIKNPTITVSDTSFKRSTLAKKAKTVQINVSGVKASDVKYKSDNKNVTVNKNGKVTLKKGLKAGKYKITVNAAGYVKNITITVKK